MKKVLKLTLRREAFDVMVTGEKNEEYRDVSAWIQSRLYTKSPSGQLTLKPYDLVEFTNGYGNHLPRFTAQYLGVERRRSVQKTYSNGLSFSTGEVYAIKLGPIVSIENWPK